MQKFISSFVRCNNGNSSKLRTTGLITVCYLINLKLDYDWVPLTNITHHLIKKGNTHNKLRSGFMFLLYRKSNSFCITAVQHQIHLNFYCCIAPNGVAW